MFYKYYCFNLGMSPEAIQRIRVGFYAHSGDIEVFEKNGSIYATFYACSENEIDRRIEDACYILLFYYPKLNINGASYEENPFENEKCTT